MRLTSVFIIGFLSLMAGIAPARARDENSPLNYFIYAHGPAANPTRMLDWIMAGLMVLVCVVIGLMLLIAIYRHEGETNSNLLPEKGGMRFITIGTGLSIAVLIALTVYMLMILNQLAVAPQKPGLTIAVTGYDWWWKVAYEKDDHSPDFVTANEIHIPVGVPVMIKLDSADVIHAFWVPQLAGKTQMIPGQSNRQWLEADEPGTYRGQCTQFCGVQHAHMAFEVIAETPEKFKAWQAAQRKAAESFNAAGKVVFMKNCAGCHTVRGSDANGEHGPDLTHLQSRELIGAGMINNNPQNLEDWIEHVQELKPGAQMPDFDLAPTDSNELLAYLATLR